MPLIRRAICYLLSLGLSGLALANKGEITPIAEEEAAPWWNISFRPKLDADASILWSDGVVISEQNARLELASDRFDLGLSLTRTHFDLNYEPGVFGLEETLRQDQWRLGADTRVSLAEHWNLLGTVSYHDGFSDYRSLWISRYYDQLFRELPGYEAPSPKGGSFSLGLEWEYIPIMAKLRLTGGYGRETIAPSYDVLSSGLSQSRPNLYTHFAQLQTENVINKRITWQNTARYSLITNREKRWSAQSNLNLALAEHLYFRLTAGGATEQPAFDARFVGGVLEYQLNEQWAVRLSGRYYEDTGEIENSLGGFNTSAPSLESFELGLGLRWQGVSSALNLYVGYYQTDYEPLAEDNLFLSNLYRDRRWGLAQLSFTHNF